MSPNEHYRLHHWLSSPTPLQFPTVTDLTQITPEDTPTKVHGKTLRMRERQQRYLELYETSHTKRHALEEAGIPEATLDNWREDPKFNRREEAVESRRLRAKPSKFITFDPFREFRKPPGLVQFRQEVFGFPSTNTHEDFAKAYDDKTNLTIFWITAAGFGKDVTAMQALAHAAADGMDLMGCIMENEKQAKKRIDAYLDPYFTDPNLSSRAPQIPGGTVPTVNFIEEWGPFKFHKDLRLPDGSRPATTKWDSLHKWFVGRTTPAADPSLWAVGLKSAIAGSRVRLLIASDLFTVENQRNAGFRQEQLELITGTINSRLDESGRLIFLNHHVRKSGESNLITLMEQYIGTARIVSVDRHYTKYANGVAVIRTPALEVSEEGIVVSAWPEKFPVKGKFVLNGEIHEIDGLTDEQHQAFADAGARRLRGLVDIRDAIGEDLFELIYQQNPKASGYGDFTDEILTSCDDATRTLGISEPHEILIVGSDPARTGGAAWVCWGLNPETEVFTLIDFFIGDSLGYSGMLDALIRQPIELYRPRDLVWEVNIEPDLPKSPEAKEVLRKYHVNLVDHRTHYNRSQGEYQVLSMLTDMRNDKMRFPAKTMADKLKVRQLKQHFQNFESVGYTERHKVRGYARTPDDGAMAAWFAWRHGHQVLKSRKREKKRSTVHQSQGVEEAFSGYGI